MEEEDPCPTGLESDEGEDRRMLGGSSSRRWFAGGLWKELRRRRRARGFCKNKKTKRKLGLGRISG